MRVFFGAFLGPIVLVIVFNTVIFALVIRIIVKQNLEKNKRIRDKYLLTKMEVFKLTLSIWGLMLLFGLTWLISIFTFVSTNRDASFALQFIFAFFNALQGFWIFFFLVVLNSEARQGWKSILLPNLGKDIPLTTKTDLFSKNKYFIDSKSSTLPTDTSMAGVDTLKHNLHPPNNVSTDLTVTNPSILQEDDEMTAPNIATIEDPLMFLNKTPEEDKDKVMDEVLLSKARVKRHSTKKRRQHEVQQIDLDFFNDEDNVDFF